MPTRRQLLLSAVTLTLVPARVRATPVLRDAALAEITGGAPVRKGRVNLAIPPLAENGLSVYTTVRVDSPMTQADHVRAIHILSEKNPIARLVSWHLTPASGQAQVSTNLRLADTQDVMALVEMSDGSFWQDTKNVVVTIAACIEGVQP
ncbi:MAG: thiosulfate oxidation carrier protein SoxY [Alphaproteobacteria bacterium]